MNVSPMSVDCDSELLYTQLVAWFVPIWEEV